ncbi:undecaprenyl-diphosphate phosphatase [Bacillus sp. DJP31]|uniref:undecaprenyl-diphosphate phosphatase n=1 Tax=Bacillus sp. DJP31 TaxID=3409789 RepID=UPI003BB4A3D6
MDLWGIIVAVILGIVEGLTEFAPVSSTGHMILVDDIWLHSKDLYSPEVANTFKVVIQLGSILAVVIVLRQRFLDLLPTKKNLTKNQEGRLGLTKVIVGLLPAIILGLLFEDYIDKYLFRKETVVLGLVAGAILMIVADKMGPKDPTVKSVDQISYKQAILVGLFQCIALWPGFSRSGSTMSGGVLLGMSHRAASDFTFIMAVPIMLGASSLSLLKNWEHFNLDTLPFLAAGFISAFIVALISVRFFLKLINKIKLTPFAIYRIVLAAVVYILFF